MLNNALLVQIYGLMCRSLLTNLFVNVIGAIHGRAARHGIFWPTAPSTIHTKIVRVFLATRWDDLRILSIEVFTLLLRIPRAALIAFIVFGYGLAFIISCVSVSCLDGGQVLAIVCRRKWQIVVDLYD